MPALKQSEAGDMEIVGKDGETKGWLPVAMRYDANSVDAIYFAADRAYVVKSIFIRRNTVATDASAVSVTVVKAPAGTAFGSGTTISSSFNLKTGANQLLQGTIEAGTGTLDANDCLGLNFTGTMTAASGVVVVMLAPA